MGSIYINVKNATGTIMGRLDVGDADINTIYSLADVREPDKKQTDYVQTFTIPGTKNNNVIFQNIFENGFDMYQYNPTIKLDAQVILNGNQYFSGALQLNKIHKLDNKYISGYDITIYGSVGSFFVDIDKYKVSDLVDLSDFKHTYNIANIKGSWDSFIWQNGAKIPFQFGNGYVYPMEFRGQTDAANWTTEHFKPAIYVKTIFDRILKSQGYTYNSRFLNSSIFQKLILPYCGEETIALSQEAIQKASVLATMNRPTAYTDDDRIAIKNASSVTNRAYPDIPVRFPNETVAPANDLGGCYDPSTGIITVPKNGKFKISTTVYTNMAFTNYGDGTPRPKNIKLVGGPMEATIKLVNITTGVVLNSKAYQYTSPIINGNNPWPWGLYPVDSLPIGNIFTDWKAMEVPYEGLLKKGDKIQVRIDWTATKSNYSYKTRQAVTVGGIIVGTKDYWTTMDLYIRANKQYYPYGTANNTAFDPNDTTRLAMALVDTTVADGDEMDINAFVPNMKALDFIKDINKMFNLYWKQVGDNEFVIEPRDDFYKTLGTIEDWTYKQDSTKEITIEPLYDLQYKQYKYTYADDNDFYNEDYKNLYRDAYGTKNIMVESDFVDGELETKVSFSPTPTTKHLSTDRVLPSYVKKSGSTMVYSKPKQRILFYGGLQPTGSEWTLYSKFESTTYKMKTYPHAGHFDNPTNPVNDLNWGVSKIYYDQWKTIIDNNLFNKYWKSQMEEMTDPNGHLLTVEMILSDVDMINFDIRKSIQFEDVYYRINKLTHNPLNNKAIVELIKSKDYSTFSPSTITAGTNAGVTIGGVISPNKGTYVDFGYNSTPVVGKTAYSARYNVPYVTAASAGFMTPLSSFTSFSPGFPTYGGTDNILATRGKSWGDQAPASNFYSTKNNNVDGNFYSPQAAQEVMGRDNNISPEATSVKVQGDNNRVSALASNISIVGDGNTIMGGVKNVTIVGNNIVASKSNVSYLHGTVIDEDGFRKDVKIVKSPTNAVGIKSNILRGGKNSVISTRIINGGQDRV